MLGPVHSFLRGEGFDARGRRLADVLAFDNGQLESVHDYIQWLFPLREASRAVPGSPVLDEQEAAQIRGDPVARAGIAAAMARMSRFYEETDGWLATFDHNHLRITRIITAIDDLLGPTQAASFQAKIIALNGIAGSPVNSDSLRHWEHAAG